VAEDVEEAQQELQQLVNVMVNYTRDNGLTLYGAKTQVMVGGKAKARDSASITITVNGAEVKPANSFELLGITFDRQFTVRPYLHILGRPGSEPAAWHACHNTSHVHNCYGSLGAGC
jgi:hypothetical protein